MHTLTPFHLMNEKVASFLINVTPNLEFNQSLLE